MQQFYEYCIDVRLREGLHARPVTSLATLLQEYEGHVSVGKYDSGSIKEYVDAKSQIELMLLGASQGAILQFRFQQVENSDIRKLKEEISKILGHETSTQKD